MDFYRYSCYINEEAKDNSVGEREEEKEEEKEEGREVGEEIIEGGRRRDGVNTEVVVDTSKVSSSNVGTPVGDVGVRVEDVDEGSSSSDEGWLDDQLNT